MSVIRFSGLLDFSAHVKGWLGYSGYGSTSSVSQHAVLQGGRDSQVLHQHFFKDTDGCTRLRYKLSELDPIIMPPLTSDGVRVFRQEKMDEVDSVLTAVLNFKIPKEWPEKNTVKRNIIEHSNLNEQQQAEWVEYFLTAVPKSVDDLTINNCLKWLFPTMVYRKRGTTMTQPTVPLVATDVEVTIEFAVTQQSLAGPSTTFGHEILIHDGHTASQAAAEKKLRQNAHQESLKAAKEKNGAQKLGTQQKMVGAQQKTVGTQHAKSSVTVPSSLKRRAIDPVMPLTIMTRSKREKTSTLTFKNTILSINDDVVTTAIPGRLGPQPYTIGYYIGNIFEFNLLEEKIHVRWYYAKKSENFWSTWLAENGNPYEEWINAADLTVDGDDHVLKLNFYEVITDSEEIRYLLDTSSLAIIQSLNLS